MNDQQPSQGENVVPTPQPLQQPTSEPVTPTEPVAQPAPAPVAVETPAPTPQPVVEQPVAPTPAPTVEQTVTQPAPVTETQPAPAPAASPAVAPEEQVYQPQSMTPQPVVETEQTIKPGEPIAAKETEKPYFPESIPDMPPEKKGSALIGLLVILLAIGGFFAYKKFFSKPAPAGTPVNAVEQQETKKYDYNIETKGKKQIITVNNERLDIEGTKIEVKELEKGFFVLAYNEEYINNILLFTKTYRKYTIDPDDILPINNANLLIKEVTFEEKDGLIYAHFKREKRISPKWYCSYEELQINEEEIVEFTTTIEITEKRIFRKKKISRRFNSYSKRYV